MMMLPLHVIAQHNNEVFVTPFGADLTSQNNPQSTKISDVCLRRIGRIAPT